MKKLSKLIVIMMIVCLATPMSAFGTVANYTHDSTTPGKSLAGVYPAYKDIDLQVSLTEAGEVELTIPTNVPKSKLAKAVADDKLVFSMDRDSERQYIDPAKFPHAFQGGDFSKWLDHRKTMDNFKDQAEPIFKVKDVKVEGVVIPPVAGSEPAQPKAAAGNTEEQPVAEPTQPTEGTENSGDVDGSTASDANTEPVQPTQPAEPTEVPATTDPVENEENGVLKLTFENKCYFYNENGKLDYSLPHTVGGFFMDLCGYYNFNVKLEDATIGNLKSKVVPYDEFRTVYEMADELEALKGYNGNFFVDVKSFGHTTVHGYDQQYVVIAKDKASVDIWLEYTELAETNPTQVLADIEAGKYDDLKVPVFVGNVHSNETSAISGILEFIKLMLDQNSEIPYKHLASFTAEGKQRLEYEKTQVYKKALSKNVASYTTEIGRIRGENGATVDDENLHGVSSPLELEKYYNVENKSINKADLLDDVFFVLVPTMNIEGHETLNRAAGDEHDPNRDEANQTLMETANYMSLIGKFNPMVYDETHGRVEGLLIEPCTPPHEPNFEYDLIAENFMGLAEALGNGSIANNDKYNSFELPARDYLDIDADSPTGVQWGEPWDDMTTAYGSQFPVLFGTCGITWEVPAYNGTVAKKVLPYGILTQANHVKSTKKNLLKSQATLFERGVKNLNSNDKVAAYYVDQYDQPGKQANLMRPVHDGEGENGNFYAECFIIPLDKAHQRNIEDAAADMKYLTRNDVKVHIADKEFTYKGVTYPKGTMVVSMYQAKRSIAHSQLFKGTFITVWKGLYSESLAQRPYSRGYDVITVAEPAEYNKIMESCGEKVTYDGSLEKLSTFAAQMSGVESADVIVSNTSNDSASAVNKLLKEGKKVGLITDGPKKGYFIMSYEDFSGLKDDYTLIAEGVYGADIPAKVIAKSPQVFVTGKTPPATSGYVGFASWRYYHSYDAYALKKMGFDMVDDVASSDAIVGQGRDSSAELNNAIIAGKPVLAHGNLASSLAGTLGYSIASCDYGTDALNFVEYPEASLVTASYVTESDFVNYQYGTSFFDNVPAGAKVIVKNAGKTPLQGCIGLFNSDLEAQFKTYNESPVAIEYKGEGKDFVVFANLLTLKRHQTDEYTFISNFLFSRMLSEEDYMGVAAPVEPSVPDNTAVSYAFTKGAGAVWTKGTDGELVFEVERNVDDQLTFGKFQRLEIGGVVVDNSQYTAEAGSVVIKLKASYLNKLKAGSYPVRVVLEDGTAVTKIQVLNKDAKLVSAHTGDSSNLFAWMTMLAGAMIITGFFYKRKRNNK